MGINFPNVDLSWTKDPHTPSDFTCGGTVASSGIVSSNLNEITPNRDAYDGVAYLISTYISDNAILTQPSSTRE
jgi:hypothetical protein